MQISNKDRGRGWRWGQNLYMLIHMIDFSSSFQTQFFIFNERLVDRISQYRYVSIKPHPGALGGGSHGLGWASQLPADSQNHPWRKEEIKMTKKQAKC